MSEYETMKIEDIMAEIEPLLSVDPDDRNLDQISMRSGRSYMAIYKHYIREGRYLEFLMSKQKTMEVYLRRYYGNELPPQSYVERPLKSKPPLKSDMDMWVKADDMWIEMSMMLHDQKAKVKFIEGALGRINTMGYEVKNAIEWRKYMDGA